jgi:signal transduction histidine kinase
MSVVDGWWQGAQRRGHALASPTGSGLVWIRPARILLDALFLASLLVTILRLETIIAFHVGFACLTLMSFAHAGRALAWRLVGGVTATTAGVGAAVAAGDLGIDELYEIPVLVIMLALAGWSVSLYRALFSQLRRQSERLHELHQASQIESREQLLLTQRLDTFGRMSAGLAHNCRNVLTTIIAVAEQMEDTTEDPSLQASARQVQNLSQQGGQLVSDMLQRVRPDDTEPATDLNAVVESRLSSLVSLVGRGVDLQIDLEPGPLVVPLRRSLVEQFLLNLVLNAKEAVNGTGVVRVATSRQMVHRPHAAVREVEMAVLSVADDGPGMSEEVQARAFEAFYSTKAPGAQGAGLGLSTSLMIAEQAGGSIRITSEPDAGTEVAVTLPLGSADLPAAAGGLASVPADQLFGSETVLLVDDDEVLRSRLSTTLALYGYDVSEAGTAGEALAEIVGRPVELVVTDVEMPGGSGPDLVAQLDQLGVRVPVLYLSGNPDADDLVPDGADLLAKPFSRTMFLLRVRSALGGADELVGGPAVSGRYGGESR